MKIPISVSVFFISIITSNADIEKFADLINQRNIIAGSHGQIEYFVSNYMISPENVALFKKDLSTFKKYDEIRNKYPQYISPRKSPSTKDCIVKYSDEGNYTKEIASASDVDPRYLKAMGYTKGKISYESSHIGSVKSKYDAVRNQISSVSDTPFQNPPAQFADIDPSIYDTKPMFAIVKGRSLTYEQEGPYHIIKTRFKNEGKSSIYYSFGDTALSQLELNSAHSKFSLVDEEKSKQIVTFYGDYKKFDKATLRYPQVIITFTFESNAIDKVKVHKVVVKEWKLSKPKMKDFIIEIPADAKVINR